MKFNGIENFDFLDGSVIFQVRVSDVPNDIQAAARQLDGEAYDADGFGLYAARERGASEYSIMYEEDPAAGEPRGVFYVDRNGDRHWFQAEITAELANEVFAACGRPMLDLDTIQGYEIKKAVLFDDGRGFALGEHPREGFVTWQFTQEGICRDYYWGHYHTDPEKAKSDFQDRVGDHQRLYSVKVLEQRPAPIAEQVKEAGRLAQERQAPPGPKKDAPDRGER